MAGAGVLAAWKCLDGRRCQGDAFPGPAYFIDGAALGVDQPVQFLAKLGGWRRTGKVVGGRSGLVQLAARLER